MTARARTRKTTSLAGGAPRVGLTPITSADAPQLFRWINDRDLVRFNSAYQPVHEPTHLRWLEGLADRADLVAFAIRLRRTGRLIGVCQLTAISRVHRSAELQIRLGEAAARGRGYGSEAVRLLLDHAFHDLNLHRVSLQVFATNAAAIRTYERAGFRHEGTAREAAFIGGEYVDVRLMGILREEAV